MREIIFTLFILTSAFSVKADAWDNLTKEEANAVVEYLEENPFIFAYCDCCTQNEGFDSQVYFLKVTSTSISTCSWNSDYFTVEYEYEFIAQIAMNSDVPNFNNIRTLEEVEAQYMEPFEFNDPIFMNYTWAYDPLENKATPFFDIIDYHYVKKYGGRTCKEYFHFPEPYLFGHINAAEGYEEWYNSK